MSEVPSRRGHPRAPFHARVSLAQAGSRRPAWARDLSSAGLGLELEAPHPERGSALETEFALPGMRLPIALQGRVAWSQPERRRLGVRFERADPDLDELIDRFVCRPG